MTVVWFLMEETPAPARRLDGYGRLSATGGVNEPRAPDAGQPGVVKKTPRTLLLPCNRARITAHVPCVDGTHRRGAAVAARNLTKTDFKICDFFGVRRHHHGSVPALQRVVVSPNCKGLATP
jgi:hypothetical protein